MTEHLTLSETVEENEKDKKILEAMLNGEDITEDDLGAAEALISELEQRLVLAKERSAERANQIQTTLEEENSKRNEGNDWRITKQL